MRPRLSFAERLCEGPEGRWGSPGGLGGGEEGDLAPALGIGEEAVGEVFGVVIVAGEVAGGEVFLEGAVR
jgi:hypothetical protein